ncbi:type IV toxin-antitoxin system AbiEi family antitoxin domain-containing protein [Desulfurispira natronophila]|uniref:Transcriptional regulator n=1 Tax=Desulfurispira natronophila TaxID=682562 RepID=A0A7W8DGH4_9BACT|nr:hypothetical protein [Desulfurispira natronophila]MBB5021359.1 hypothetical protein [Desulfurispira natronophila]
MKMDIRTTIQSDIFDYQTLMLALKGYSRPRSKVTALLASGDIIRVRKGLYVFSDDLRKGRLSREVLANLIYGPSYVSLESALSYYGLIPECPVIVTSVTTGRTRRYDTPVGYFRYQMLPLPAYRVGMDIAADGNSQYLIARPEKALADFVAQNRNISFTSCRAMERFLLEECRVDEESLMSLSLSTLDSIASHYTRKKVTLLAETLRRLQS